MRLLNVIHSANPAGGGVIEAVLQMSRAHQRQGHTVEIVSLDAPDAPWIRESTFPIWALGPGLSSFGYAPRMVSWLREHRHNYEVVVGNGLWQFSSLGIRRALNDTATPYVVFPHGMLDPWFKHAYPLKHLKKSLYWLLGEYRVLRGARAVLFTSEEERRLARQSFRPYLCNEVVTALGTCAPPGDAASQRELFFASFPHLRGRRLVLFLGRLHEKKGCDLLIQAFARVRAESGLQHQNGGELHLVLAGPPKDEAYLQQLKRAAAFHFPGEIPPITWTGMLSGDLKWGAYRAAETFVLPSHQENFGFSVVEALACELPVLISDKVNIWREIEADRAGLVASDDLEGTVRLLRGWLAMADEFRQQMRVSALRCFLSRFEIELAAGNFIDLLEELLQPAPEGDLPDVPSIVESKH
jgi:glycosyltransferase involved in cell wall biosynthesis